MRYDNYVGRVNGKRIQALIEFNLDTLRKLVTERKEIGK